MGLIKCPECGNDISDKAIKCPKCGYPIQSHLEIEKIEGEDQKEIDETLNVDFNVNNKRKKSKKLVAGGVILIMILLGTIFVYQKINTRLVVEDITIKKWSLTDTVEELDYYKGIVETEQKRPFIAIIGNYGDEKVYPHFVYMEDGEGVIEIELDINTEPGLEYRPIGYLQGKLVDVSDLKIAYKDREYNDWEYSEKTSCNIDFNFEMNCGKTGVLVCDIENKTNNEITKNQIITVIDGKAEFTQYVYLPYKERGVDISVTPKMFCESTALLQEDYSIEKPYEVEKEDLTYYTFYKGSEVVSFNDVKEGIVLYTEKLLSGGEKGKRNIMKMQSSLIHNGECEIKTFDAEEGDAKMLKPEYQFEILGYISWTSIGEEIH